MRKKELLEGMRDKEARAIIIASLSSDEAKVELLNQIILDRSDDYSAGYLDGEEAEIVASLSSDEDKEKFWGYINSDFDRARVLASFISDENKKRLLSELRLDNNYVRGLIVASLSSDADKRRYLESMTYDWHRYHEDLDQFEVEQAERFGADLDEIIVDESGRALVIASLSNDEDKKAWIERLNCDDDRAKAMVIASLSSDKDKKELLRDMYYKYKAMVIASLSNDEDKKELLKDIKDEESRAEIIASLSSDEDKKELLKDIKDEESRVRIIASLSNEADRVKLLRDIEWDRNRAIIIATLGDDVEFTFEPDLTTLSMEELERMEAELDAKIDKNGGEIERLKQDQKRKELIRRIQAKQETVEAQKRELEELQQGKGEEPGRGQAHPGD